MPLIGGGVIQSRRWQFFAGMLPTGLVSRTLLSRFRTIPAPQQGPVAHAPIPEPIRREARRAGLRELRWHEVRDLAAAKMSCSEDPRVSSALSEVLAVYEDEWPDADLYAYYRSK